VVSKVIIEVLDGIFNERLNKIKTATK